MATPRPENRPDNRTDKRLRKKRKPPKKFRLSYSLLLLLVMPIVGLITGFIAYSFGKQALEGVNPSPTGVKLPRINPQSPSPKPPSAKPTSQSQGNQNISMWLDESSVIAEIQMRSQSELGALRRPNITTSAKSKQIDRRTIFARVDRAYNSMRDPLAISANADERISARIAALRQRVYSQSAMLDRSLERDFVSPSSTTTLTSSEVQVNPNRDRWQQRDTDLVNSFDAPSVPPIPLNGDASDSKPPSFFISEPAAPTQLELNR